VQISCKHLLALQHRYHGPQAASDYACFAPALQQHRSAVRAAATVAMAGKKGAELVAAWNGQRKRKRSGGCLGDQPGVAARIRTVFDQYLTSI
jgi:hypothetical protein